MSTPVKVVLTLVGIWILLGIIGWVVHALFWLFVIACLGFAATVALGARRNRLTGRRY